MATIEIENNARIERLLTENPDMAKRIKRCIRVVMEQAQSIAQQNAVSLSTKQAYKAIRKAVYSKVFGGNLNIISGNRRTGNRASLSPIYHALEHRVNSAGNHRGGNRMPRSRRTEDLLTYAGEDRGFILRFIEMGTPGRDGNGVRQVGKIQARQWFGRVSNNAIEKALVQLDQLLDQVIEEQLND